MADRFDVNTYRMVVNSDGYSFFAMTDTEEWSIRQKRLSVLVILKIFYFTYQLLQQKPTLQAAELTKGMLVAQGLFTPLGTDER